MPPPFRVECPLASAAELYFAATIRLGVDEHYVMLGASWATDARLVRRSFRNWFQPHYPYVFAKFRCVAAP